MAIATANTLILPPQNSSTIFQWVNAATVTSSDTTAAMVGIAAIAQATLFLSVTAASGTSPTLDVYLQKQLPDASTWHDIAHFTQVASAPTKRVMSLVTGGNKEEAQQTNALAAATVNSVAFGSTWRLSAVLGGTSPSFTFSVWMEGQS